MNRKQIYNAFIQAVASYYNVPFSEVRLGEEFSIEAPKAALLGTNIQQSSDFLKEINMAQVAEIKGLKLWGATEKGITGRKPSSRHIATLNHNQSGYELSRTDSGILVPWEMFDQFARFGDKLPSLYAEFFNKQIALDMLQIAWNGVSIAATTSKADLSDVNKGWLQLLKEQKSSNVYTGNSQNKITLYGTDAEFASLDELALDLKQGLDLRHQNRTDLVFLVGADLVNAESKYISKASKLTATERAALGSHNLVSTFAGMRTITPPNFPAKGAVVTTLSNLSIYTQSTSVRRRFESNQDKMGVITSYYRNEGYVVEDTGLMTAIEANNVEIGKPDKTMAEANS
ncbi:phage major capsid protein, P2 family [Pasteurella multocida]